MKRWFLRHERLGEKDPDSLKQGKQMRAALLWLQLAVLREFTGPAAERRNLSRAQRAPEIEEMELGAWRDQRSQRSQGGS